MKFERIWSDTHLVGLVRSRTVSRSDRALLTPVCLVDDARSCLVRAGTQPNR